MTRPEFPEWTGFSGRFHGDGVEKTELYNLEEDIGETKNLASDYPEVISSLQVLAENAHQELGDYNRIGRGARFYEDTLKRPGLME